MILRSFTPTWHPSEAKNYFTLYNNVNKTNNIIYYDTTSSLINTPKKFTYQRTNSTYDLKLYKVTTNTNSDNPVFSPSLPSTSGTFTINKIAPNSGSSAPTIDLYFQGTIQTYVNWNGDYPSNVGYNGYSATLTPNTFPNSTNISVHYQYSGRYIDSGYTYYGDSVEISSSWTTAVRTSANANDTITYPAPTEALIVKSDTPPILYVYNWVRSGSDGGGDDPGAEYYTVDTATGGTEMSNHGTYWSSGSFCSIEAGRYKIVDYWTSGIPIFVYSGSSTGYAKIP